MSATCEHPDFECYNRVIRIDDGSPMRYSLDVHVRCAVCGVRFEFIGPGMGASPDRPMVSPDRFELRAPIRPNAHVTTLMAGDPETAWPGSISAIEVYCTKKQGCPKHSPAPCP